MLHLGNQRVLWVLGAKDFLRDLVLIPLVDLFNPQDCNEFVLYTAEGNLAVQMKLRRGINGQRQRNREYMSAAQPHFIEDALMLLFADKTIERRESAASQQFKIAHRALGDLKRRKPIRM